jgi:hypothetical protein
MAKLSSRIRRGGHATVALACFLSIAACESSENNASDGSAGKGGSGSGGTDAKGGSETQPSEGGAAGDNTPPSGQAGSGADDAGGAGGDDGGPATPVTSWIVGHWTTDAAGAYLGSVLLLDDLSEGGTVDLTKGEDFGTDISYASPGNGVLFVGRKAQPNLQRFHVLESGELQLTGQLGLDAYGVADTLGRSQPVVQFIDDQHAYYIDLPTLQVIVFNPSATPMTIYPNDTFSIDGLEEDGLEVNVTAVRRDGDRITVIARYYLNDNAAALVKVAIIDVKTNDVTYTEDTRCGQVAYSVSDPDGNIYFGSHGALSIYAAAGLAPADTPPACIVRIKKGATEFDQDYFVDLETVSGGGVVGSLLQGVDGYAYVMQYSGAVPTIAAQARSALAAASWELHSLKLADAEDTYTKVAGVPVGSAYSASFMTTVGLTKVPFLILPGDELKRAYFWDVSDPSAPKRALGFPGTPGHAVPFN